MELWIRSQDKLRLAKIESVIINYNMQTEILGNCYSADGIEKDIPLGEYATKERTIEILDEIQKLLQPQMVLSKVGKPIAETCDGIVYVNPDEYEIKELSTYVYEMPEE